jgi:archaellin
MAVIDEEGRLFGVVNVIDLLVVLVVVAVVAAGVALLTGGDDQGQQPDTGSNATNATTTVRYATLSVTSDVANLSGRIDVNDTIQPLPSGTPLRVTDTYVAPTNGGTRVVARVRYNGTLPTVDGSAVPIGNAINFREDDLGAQARVLAANETGASLPTRTTPVVVETNLSPARLDALQAGDELTVEGETVATVASVAAYPRNDDDSVRAVVGLRLRTIEQQGRPVYGTERVVVGREVNVRTDDSEFEAVITATNRARLLGESTDATVTVSLADVSPTVADQLEAGLNERHRGATATVEAVDSEPATVVTATDDGRLVETTHPRNRDVTLTLDVTARRVGDELRFHGRPLGVGDAVALDFERVDVRGTVVGFRTN